MTTKVQVMVAMLIVDGKLLNPGEIVSLKMKRVLSRKFLFKKKQNNEQNRTMIMVVMKMIIILILMLIKVVQIMGITLNIIEDRPSLVTNVNPERDTLMSYTCNIQIGKKNSLETVQGNRSFSIVTKKYSCYW